ncbi:glycosyltransferase family 2 protein [Lactiplantibacillus modestisalitolerans]|uniref:Glycosyltransferase family 2 protein n=1 Tax=Lactiplantibacillus modestisalitolerans TaxID=1457219 RepID=A0ABV5WSA6_9LACO|nr:glycosyltransferase family 2 protein [Lactiplantibacillus modestisalitolerans]
MSNLTAFILIFFRLLARKNQVHLQVPALTTAQPLPAVDLIIVTHNEDVDLLRKTVNAATFIDYPDKRKLNVVIADDLNRPEVRALARQYHVQYIGMEGNQHAKSGNINHALEHLSAPLFAIFDTDMIPFTGFLTDTVPLFQQNRQLRAEAAAKHQPPVKQLGFVQTPQSFYNADIFQFNLFSEKIVPNEQDFFSRDVNVLNGSNETALFTGSNALFSRAAVDAVGGFPTNTLTEDFQLGSEINMAGYTSLATSKPQSSGITPIDLKGVIKQRKRWARGVIRSCRNLHIFINPKLSFKNRLILINSYLYWWSFLRRIIYMIAPILYALFKVQVVNANFWILMIIWAPGYFLLHYVLKDTSDSIRNERWGEIQETFFAPYLFLPVILETLGIRAKKFKVTDKHVTFSLIDKLYIIPYFLFWLVTLIAIIKFNYGKFGSEILIGSVITFWLLMHFINLSFCLFIAMGRPVYRKTERFSRQVNGQLWVKNGWQPLTTLDTSEGGLSFSLTNPTDLHPGQTLRLRLTPPQSAPIALTGELMRVSDADTKPVYSLQVQLPDRENEDRYLHLIYNGFNDALPQQQDTWVTPFDELYTNVMMRLEKWERQLSRLTRF